MKFMDYSRRLVMARRAMRLHARELRSKEKRKYKRVMIATGERVTVFRSTGTSSAIASSKVLMPEVFCLDGNTSETIKFLSGMRNTILRRAVDVATKSPANRKPFGLEQLFSYYDFKSVKQITPTAALVLAALYDRQKYIAGRRLNTVDEHLWDPYVLNVLKSLGFHQLLEMKRNSPAVHKDNNVRILEFVSGDQADGSSAGAIQSALVKLLPDQEGERLLDVEPYAGMLEAILNSRSWAYPNDMEWDFPQLKRWWMTGSVNFKEKLVTVMVFDQGVSIPVSLPKWEHWPLLKRRAQKLAVRAKILHPVDHYTNDGVAIALAMKIAKSATGLPQHGKGLHSMVEVVERAKSGRLRIMSRNGDYIWEKGRKPKISTHEFPIGGTLIEWKLKL